jgi:hypothetical protein
MSDMKKKPNDVATNIAELLDRLKELVQLQTTFTKQRIEEFKKWSDDDCDCPECGEPVSTSEDDEPAYSDDFEEEWS